MTTPSALVRVDRLEKADDYQTSKEFALTCQNASGEQVATRLHETILPQLVKALSLHTSTAHLVTLVATKLVQEALIDALFEKGPTNALPDAFAGRYQQIVRSHNEAIPRNAELVAAIEAAYIPLGARVGLYRQNS